MIMRTNGNQTFFEVDKFFHRTSSTKKPILYLIKTYSYEAA